MKTSGEYPGNAPREQAALFFGACFLILALGLPLRADANDADNREKEVWNVAPSSPRALSSVLLDQIASFFGVPAPVPGLGGDEGLGLHQDGTVRKAGGATGNAGPSENGQRAAAYMRSGLNNEHGLYGGGSGHNSYDPLTGRHDSARGGHRTSGQIRDFSNFDPLHATRDRALSWGLGFLNSSAESLLSGIMDNGRARLNFTADRDGRFQGEGDALLPFYDSRYTTIFTQIGARSMAVSGGETDGQDRWIGNFGLGQRWFPNATEEDSGDWMFGYNAFFDNDFTRSHQRGGLGLELQYDWLRLASNYYFPLSGWKGSYDFDSRFIEERPAQGWDARLKAYLPFYRNVALTGAYTQWYGDHVGMFGPRHLEKNPKVWSWGIEYTPVPLVSGFVTQRSTERGRTDTEFGLNFIWHFGMPWDDQVKHSKVAELRTVSGSRHELVDRENRIILEYRAKDASRIEYLGPAGPNLFRFRVVNGFDEFMPGQTVYMTADGMYLAEAAPPRPASPLARAAQWLDDLLSVRAAHAAFRSRSYVTDRRGEILVALDENSLPPGGAVTVTARIGKSEQTFTLNGQALNGMVLTFSGGDDFTTAGPQGYQSILTMTVKKYVNGVEQPLSGNVTWEVDSEITGLSTGTYGVWRRDVSAKNGLVWVATDSTSVVGTTSADGTTTTDWNADEIKGTPPTGGTAYLADIVGSRKITVTVTVAGENLTDTHTFGAGPLSKFGRVNVDPQPVQSPQKGNKGANWDDAYAFCNGKTSPFIGNHTPENGWTPNTYVGGPNMPTPQEYQAVSPQTEYSGTDSKGAALAAGWPAIDDSHDHYWTGSPNPNDINAGQTVFLRYGYAGGRNLNWTQPFACRR